MQDQRNALADVITYLNLRASLSRHADRTTRAMLLEYRGQTLDVAYRLDVPVNELVVVEVKAVERL
jgi:hypothetical protein